MFKRCARCHHTAMLHSRVGCLKQIQKDVEWKMADDGYEEKLYNNGSGNKYCPCRRFARKPKFKVTGDRHI